MRISITPRAMLRTLIIWALVAFFIAGGAGNIFAPPAIQEDYARWGYPDWFHYITGTLELAVVPLIASEGTRRVGTAIGALVMASALLTLLAHGELTHALAPAIVLGALLICLKLDAKAREVRWECKVF